MSSLEAPIKVEKDYSAVVDVALPEADALAKVKQTGNWRGRGAGVALLSAGANPRISNLPIPPAPVTHSCFFF